MINEIMSDIQSRLKAPKGQMNKFGNYKYRSCEDIVEAVKPLLAEHKAVINIQDEMVQLGDRFYVKATATIHVGKESMSSTAYAREPLLKKGMDEAQITGATSSYARKYALNGLLAIDDTKDADSNEATGEAHAKSNVNGTVPNAEKVLERIEQALEIMNSNDTMQECHEKIRSVLDGLSNDEKMLFGEKLKVRKYTSEDTGRERSYATLFRELWDYTGEAA